MNAGKRRRHVDADLRHLFARGVVACLLLAGPARAQIGRTPIASGPILVSDWQFSGSGLIPVHLHGKSATLVADLRSADGIALSISALERLQITLPDSTVIDSIDIGRQRVRHIPVRLENMSVAGIERPDSLGPIIGVAGGAFIHNYDVLYDPPHNRIALYEKVPVAKKAIASWLPAGMHASDCGAMRAIPPGFNTFTGMDLQLDGHHVTGVLEMMSYGDTLPDRGDEKINGWALKALALPQGAMRIGPNPSGEGDRVTNVQLGFGARSFWSGPVKIFDVFEVENEMAPHTPIALLNLKTLAKVALFNSESSRRVCLGPVSSN